MKLKLIILLSVVLLSNGVRQFMMPMNQVVTPMPMFNNALIPQVNPNQYYSDKVLNEIRDNIYDYAEKLYTHVDLEKKKILVGQLPDSYPKEMRKNALLARQNHITSDPIMLYPTAIWRSCIFPNFKVSYVSLCHDRLAVNTSKTKLNGRDIPLL
jgi:hypothetical protein